MKIVLIGYRAAGKSTLANFLAKRLQWSCFDIDRGIERLRDRQEINTTFFSAVTALSCVSLPIGRVFRKRIALFIFLQTLSKQTIKQIYQDSGEKAYRDIESQIVREMCSQDQRIISLGVGCIYYSSTN